MGGTAPLNHNLDTGCEWPASSPGRFALRKKRQPPNEYETGWTPESLFGKHENPLPLPGIEFRIIQPVTSSLYYAISAHNFINIYNENNPILYEILANLLITSLYLYTKHLL